MRSVSPQFLEPVELAVLSQEDVGYNVAVVKDDPEVILQPLGAERFPTKFPHFVYHIVSYGVDVGCGISVADHEMVCDRRAKWPEVYVDDVLSFLVEHSVCHNPQIVCYHIENVLYFCVTIQIYKYTTKSERMKEEVDIQWLDEVDSTNNEALRRIGVISNLTVLAAVNQTAGRGQRGNSWLTHAGENLTFSMVVKFGGDQFPMLKANMQFRITVSVTLGVMDYLEGKGIDCRVKWPNDIYVRSRKICGMLIENSLNDNLISYSIVGIGLNVNQKEFPPQLVNPVSLSLLTGKEYDIRLELTVLCECVRRRLIDLGSPDSFNEYVGKLFRRDVFYEYVICSTGVTVKAKIIGVTDYGLLVLETEKGERMEFAFKEISYVI